MEAVKTVLASAILANCAFGFGTAALTGTQASELHRVWASVVGMTLTGLWLLWRWRIRTGAGSPQ